jgi:hypothetical protein
MPVLSPSQRRSSSVEEDRRRPRFSSFAAGLMPPVAGLRPNPAPLRNQGKDTQRHEHGEGGRVILLAYDGSLLVFG